MSKSAADKPEAWRKSLMMIRGSILLILVFAAGCSQPLPPAANPERARAALQTALDALQNGETAESLRARSPAIHLNDAEWQLGERLVKYQIESEQPNGQGWRCVVLLTVQAGRGNPTQRRASYVIDTDPALVIVREP